MYKHVSVLNEEAVDLLDIKPNGIYVDATLGGCGHTKRILSKLTTGKLICFDQDITAINNAKIELSNFDNVVLIHDNFKNVCMHLDVMEIPKIDGILFDLGVSSMQIDKEERGFSYSKDGPLDMRMNQDAMLNAEIIINEYQVNQLITIFDKYGEEKFSKKIAFLLDKKRKEKRITTTKELNEIIFEAIPTKAFYQSNSHPSIRVFQALRIEVNKELEVFEDTLTNIEKYVNKGGRISVITFHSLEDRICKYHFNKLVKIDSELAKLPVVPEEFLPKWELINRKVILPSKEELEVNSRSRSAKLRVICRKEH